jgi:hypothetical protein
MSARNGHAAKAAPPKVELIDKSKAPASVAARVAKLEADVEEFKAVLKALVTNQVMQAAAPAALQKLQAEISDRIDTEGLSAILPSG